MVKKGNHCLSVPFSLKKEERGDKMKSFKPEKINKEALNKELKIKQLQLNALSLKVKDSPYNRSEEVVEDKKRKLIKEINELKEILLQNINL